MTRPLLTLLLGGILAACVAPQTPDQAPAAAPASEPVDRAETEWRFSDQADQLRAASCPANTTFTRGQALTISADPIATGPADAPGEMLTGMHFAGAWHLTADDPNFGGLSGLAALGSGSLLAITDAGAFVWIGIDPETGAPDGFGSIGYMRNGDGELFGRKVEADSEGLAVRDGLALVSFEQDHRIEAFDLEGCGTTARAARVVDLPRVVSGKRLPDNRGAEALALQGETLMVGFEFRSVEGSPMARVVGDRDLTDISPLYQPGLYLQTGMDYADGLVAHLFRAYDPMRGPRVQLWISPENGGESVAFADLNAPLPVDNFEGVAFGKTPGGGTRIWLISDDNFSRNQRTLLFAFDLD